jgi:hypothetical protein
LCQSYVALMLAPDDKDGVRTVQVARFGAYEVRMVELASARALHDSDFWLELYCSDTRSTLDSCRCWDIDEAEAVADHLISCARQLAGSCPESQISSCPAAVAASVSGSFSDNSL